MMFYSFGTQFSADFLQKCLYLSLTFAKKAIMPLDLNAIIADNAKPHKEHSKY